MHATPNLAVPVMIRRKAAAEEERFDFLRPVLAAPEQDDSISEAVSASGGGKRKRSNTAGRQRLKPRKHEESEDNRSTATAAGSGISALSDTLKSGAGEGSRLLALAGLDEESRRALLLGGPATTYGAAAGIGDEEDEDYDNC